ncbi:PIN domain-containing protein [Caulobacter sp. 73W]|uniref:PIN domain-containing protein n=1 Tax=Caulobacter sp. 73W TaxID=3161137 RepID=A0AB39KXY3_9CAUL
MILVDSSVWVGHFREPNDQLVRLLEGRQVLCHPFISGEIALGNLRRRDIVLTSLRRLPQAVVARDSEVTDLVERKSLHGRGVGYFDVHLLASALVTPDAQLWSNDRRLALIASELGVAFLAAH